MMRKRTMYGICALLGAIGLIAFAESDWFLAAIMGAGLGLTFALMVHSYPNDIAPPSDRRHENSQRRRGVRV
jgi:cyanate permease